ncbi:SOUL family heme-binding protein [Thiocystis violacea]|uniref:SOUL family heme-binding protein n=1 Tax=Thiocystis violacea TaxID=13725 RepID=UPI00190314DD|nr:heme-binding protein [Thiocystis violacea]MBK1717107.1 heme-binding protein [Thiocystis violacea]
MKILLILLSALALLGITAMAVFVFVVQNVETPAYEVVVAEGAFELRDYPAMVVAEVAREGARKEALSEAFSPLANYIFAKDRAGTRVAMTAPVIQQPEERIAMTAPVTQSRSEGDRWTVSFIMPADRALAALPPPGSTDVRLREIPPRRTAAVRFSGRTTDALIAEHEAALLEWMRSRDLKPASPPVYAYYNDPLTPGFLRRNEVLIGVAKD